MSQTSLICSECGATLRLAAPVPPGKNVRCPKCQSVFTVPNVSIRKTPPARRVALAIEAEPEEDFEDESKRKRRKRKKTGPSRKPLLLYGGIAVLLLAGLVTTLILVTRTKDDQNPSGPEAPKQSAGGPRTLVEVKAATVLIKVRSGPLSTSGSGFIFRTRNGSALIATNCHVVAPRPTLDEAGEKSEVTVVLDSGTRKPRPFEAEVLALDPERDLAFVRIIGVSDLPKALDPEKPAELRETLPVRVCGFPFGEDLAQKTGNPEITIAESAVSSLRKDGTGLVEVVQVGSGINPGNSGGPIVDDDGRLVGISVASVKDSGIGIALPPHELMRMYHGRVGTPLLLPLREGGSVEYLAVVPLIDPLNKLRSIKLHHSDTNVLANHSRPGANGEWTPLPGSRELTLEKVRNKVGVTRMQLKPRGTVSDVVQVSYVNGEGKTIVTEPTTFSLTGAPVREDPTKKTDPSSRNDAFSLSMVNRFPDRFVGQTVTFHARLQGSVVMHGEDCELQVLDDGNAKPQKIEFATTKDISTEWSQESKPGQWYDVKLSGKIEQTKKLGPTGRIVFQVSRIELLAGPGQLGKVIPSR